MMDGIAYTRSDLACSDNGEHGEDEDDQEKEQGQLSKDDKPGWMMGTITKSVQQCLERFRQKQMKLDELSQPGWQDAPDSFSEIHMKYGTSTLRVPAVVQQLSDDIEATPVLTTIGEDLECLYIVPRISLMLHGHLDLEVVILS